MELGNIHYCNVIQLNWSDYFYKPVRTISGCHDNNMSTLLQTIHQCKKLGYNTSLHLSMSLKRCVDINIIYNYIYTLSLFGAMASNSSINIIAGAFFSASSNAIRITSSILILIES